MITKFKIFENNIFGGKQNTYWFIKGDETDIRKILMKLYEDKEYLDYKGSLQNIIYHIFRNTIKYENMYGIFLFLIINNRFEFELKFKSVFSEEEKNDILNNTNEYLFGISFRDYKYQGEIKLDNGKFIVDTLDIDIKKYNL